jgi:predicted transcriptional regulator
MLPSYARMASTGVPTVRQNVVQPVSQAVQAVPQVVKTAPQKVAEALRRTPSEMEMRIATAPSAEELATRSSQLFKQAKESNVELNAKDFSNTMKTFSKDLREEGYDPRSYSKLEVAFSELQNAKIPKDFNELKTLRKFIQGAQKSPDLEEKRLATILKDKFDDYVLNIPESSVKAGDKQGLQAWKEARDVYGRMSKAEIFDDMLETAELTKGKFSQSGLENALYNELKKLATNEKRMRLFTLEEQEAIKQAVRGSNLQNVVRIFGKFAPTSSVSSILPSILTTAVSGPLGLGLTAGAYGARAAATKMRKGDVNKLAALMRAGKKQEERK